MPSGVASQSRRSTARRNLRNATFILPRTGERVKRVFSLPSLYGEDPESGRDEDGAPEEAESLLGHVEEVPTKRETAMKRIYQARDSVIDFWSSSLGQGIFKCSLAYLLGSLATFVPFISAFLGKQDGKHVVATVTVYFHPSRTAGSMAQAVVIAFGAFLYAAFISFTSMGVSIAFGQRDLIWLGHAVVLVVFCAGGLGFVAWLKQKLAHPTVNVGCSLASLAMITVLVKEGAIQAAKFSNDKVVQVLKMVILGMFATSAVNLIVRPKFASKELRRDMSKTTDYLADKLMAITRAFLMGTDSELQSLAYQKIEKDHKTSTGSMNKNLKESRWELYVAGREKQYRIDVRIVRCLQRLSQSIGGLHSAALTQFTFLKNAFPLPHNTPAGSTPVSLFGTPTMVSEPFEIDKRPTLEAIHEAAEEETVSPGEPNPTDHSNTTSMANSSMTVGRHALAPSEMFTTFISSLGPPMKSLAYTLKQILDELPFQAGTDNTVAVNANFRPSLVSAIELFRSARREGTSKLYRNKDISNARTVDRVADLEEVAASCGHFASAMEDFAEEVVVYLDLLEELKSEKERHPRPRSWWWLAVWRRWASGNQSDEEEGTKFLHVPQNMEQEQISTEMAKPIRQADNFATQGQKSHDPIIRKVYRAVRVLRRDDIRFAVKVGVGAALLALPAFLPSTRPFFAHWRGEWGLVSYMVVCSMTIGASNTTGFERFLGTAMGAVFAIVAWIVADGSPWLLGFFGWLASLGCFYIILGLNKGPMGRFILLTYNLSALYSYSLSVMDNDDDDDEGGISPEIWEIVLHRFASVVVGCVWAIIVTRVVWPISARKKLKDGICLLWLRMSLIWKRDPLAIILLGEPASNYMDIREEAELQNYLLQLDGLRKAAMSEFELQASFPDKVVKRILDGTQRMLDNFHAMNIVITKDLKASPGEAEVLRYTRAERFALSARISHLFSVLASSIKLEYPLTDVLPNTEHARDRLLAKLFEFRRDSDKAGIATEEDYELLYAYALVTGQLAQEIMLIGNDLEELFGKLNEDNLRLY